jgi:hypothetical protein
LLSRITSSGDDSDKFSSAACFTGDNVTPGRVMEITHTKKGDLHHDAFLRERFVTCLNRHLHASGLTTQQGESMFQWAEKTHQTHCSDNFCTWDFFSLIHSCCC